jgi:hypothetical protein
MFLTRSFLAAAGAGLGGARGAVGGVAARALAAPVDADGAAEGVHDRPVWGAAVSELAMVSGNGAEDPAEAYARVFQSAERYRREAAEAGETASRLRAEAERLAGLAADWETKQRDCEQRLAQAGARGRLGAVAHDTAGEVPLHQGVRQGGL